MNIFYLDHDPRECARMHCDQHVRKMMLEYAQILSTAIHLKLKFRNHWGKIYKPTHQNHPSVRWAAETLAQYDWLYLLWVNLHDEYIYRFGKNHKSFVDLNQYLSDAPFYYNVDGVMFNPPPQVMPEEYKKPGFPVIGYRNYYIHEKSRFATWTRREPPMWFLQGVKKNGYKLPEDIRIEGNAPASRRAG
uniref:Uncharacterized protein n=1 Tax=uncultured microorganism TaxID=358574 RepID=A0A2U8U0L9_9ZZZZ|nr:hypothetical protein [uncultured microorganism]